MRRVRRTTAVIAMLAALVLTPLTAAHAAPPQATFAYGLTVTNRLVLFNVATPGTILRNVAVTGLAPGDTLLGIDVRPATGQLYGLGQSGRLYVIDPVTGVATAVAPPTFGIVAGIEIATDFNPTVDRLRLVTQGGGNVRLVPDTGVLIPDSNVNYILGDPGFGIAPQVTGVAYTNNVPGSLSTSLYDIDSNRDVLVQQTNPNAGSLVTIGALGVNTDTRVGFDIVTVSGANSAFASLTPVGSPTSNLYTIDLGTGAATLVGTIGGGTVIRGLALASGALACTVPVGTAGRDLRLSRDDRLRNSGQ